ncbi:hypothetical protein F5Y06DRAFT_285483 [Hypoxylon sp. FL0890]|nr:hypothetical protein F5Y06DRAFT_285483 [Hypoxylon sp. FL0890]
MSNPACAYACHDALRDYQLSCSVLGVSDGHHHMGDMNMPMFTTSPDCYAIDDNYLRSVSYCISTHCPDVSISDLEHYWETYLIGRSPDQPTPKEPYTIALLQADPPPNTIADPMKLLNITTLVSEPVYLEVYNANFYFAQMEIRQNTFGLVLLITGAVIPIACSLLRFVPFPKVIVSWFNAHFIDPPLFGRRHRNPVLNIAIMPTRGQAILIAYFIAINVVISCAGYSLVLPNAYYGKKHDQLLVYLANREAVLSLANLPLLVLYAGRNNFLLSITDWSYSTFLLLHRWIVIICTIEACIHAALYLHIYLIEDEYDVESQEPFWICGIVAILAFSILLPASVLPLRQKMYNLFLGSHFILVFTALVGVYFHIFHRFKRQWGYETWIYIAFGIWAFDRAMRFLRLAGNGLRTAEITIIDENNIRVDIPGVTAQGHAYLYFPTLSWRVWENHPFSVMGALMAREPQKRSSPSSTTMGENASIPSSVDIEKSRMSSSTFNLNGYIAPPPERASFQPGLTFFITTRGNGLTAALHNKKRLPVLVESSYAPSSLDELRTVPHCIVIAGGVGITAVVPVLRTRGNGCVRLFWGTRSPQLVDAVRTVLGADILGSSTVGEIAVGRRLDLRAILEREVLEGSETAVVVCGPSSMADEVREIVCELGRKGRTVQLVDEAFSW